MPYECSLCRAFFAGYNAKGSLVNHLRQINPDVYARQRNRYSTGGANTEKPADYFNCYTEPEA